MDGTDERHFVNGAFVESTCTACAGAIGNNDDAFKIGARGGNGGHSSQFRGSVDEAMVFGSCLSDADVQAVYDMTYKAPPPDVNIDLSVLPAGLIGYNIGLLMVTVAMHQERCCLRPKWSMQSG